MKLLGKYQGYNSTLNPTTSNVFATAAMRFGHTLINKQLIRKFLSRGKRNMPLSKAFFVPHLLFEPGMLDSILKGLITMPLKEPKPEQAINDDLTDHLFESSRYQPLDLSSINIQRGRDHALPGYNQWRTMCQLNKAVIFDDLKYEIRNPVIRDKLKQLYGDPNNIDLWVGAILEDSVEGGKVGPTFRCLLVEQFQRLRDGDRFFYKVISYKIQANN